MNFAQTNEEWRDIIDCPGYKISNQGRVMSPKGAIRKTKKSGAGYEYIRIYGGDCGVNISRLVAIAFLPASNHTEVNHRDGNKWNNNVENLEWCSRSQNCVHALSNGLKKTSLDVYQVMTIKKCLAEGIKSSLLVKYFGVSKGCISAILTGRSWAYLNTI